MKQIKLQETQFGNDKLFQQAQILKDNPELLEGKPVEFEVVSPDYEREFTEGEYKDSLNCFNCTHYKCIDIDEGVDSWRANFQCDKTKLIIKKQYDDYDEHLSENKLKCPLLKKQYKKDNKKLGTMKLELIMVDKFIDNQRNVKSNGTILGRKWSRCGEMLITRNNDYEISFEEYKFIKDNEYFKKNDLVVVLKVSEVKRYG